MSNGIAGKDSGLVLPDGPIRGMLTPGASLGSLLDDEADDRKHSSTHPPTPLHSRTSGITAAPDYLRRMLGLACNTFTSHVQVPQ
jgi:hypothetical protein